METQITSDYPTANGKGFVLQGSLRDIVLERPAHGVRAAPRDIPSVALEWMYTTSYPTGAWFGDLGELGTTGFRDSLFTGYLASGVTCKVSGVPYSWGGAGVGWVAKNPAEYSAGDTYESALAAINAAHAAGGGIVRFGRVTIDLGANYLPLKNGVTYLGAGFVTLNAAIPDDPFVTIDETKGTVLKNDGTHPLFWDEKTDLTDAYVDPGDYCNDSTIFRVDGFGLVGGAFGLKVGANYSPGGHYSTITNVCAIGSSQWGIWLENMIHCRYDKVYAFNCTAGQVMFMSSCSALFNPVNCVIGEICCTAAMDYRSRGIEVVAKNGTLGGLASSAFLQSNRFNMLPFANQSATCDGTALIAVTDGSAFSVGLPIYIESAGTSGLKLNTGYIVRSVSGNTITISESYNSRNPTLTPSAGIIAIASKGYCPLTVRGDDITDTPKLGSIDCLDLESGGTALAWLDSLSNAAIRAPGSLEDSDYAKFAFVLRYCHTVGFVMQSGLTYDIDLYSVNISLIGPSKSFPNNSPICLGADSGDFGGLWLSKRNIGRRRATLITRLPSNGDWTQPEIPIGIAVGFVGEYQTLGLNAGGMGNTHVYTGANPATWTWNQDASDDMIGYRFTVKNKGTGVLTFVLGGSGNGSFDGTGKTSITLTPKSAAAIGGSVTIECVASGTWVITAAIGAALA